MQAMQIRRSCLRSRRSQAENGAKVSHRLLHSSYDPPFLHSAPPRVTLPDNFSGGVTGRVTLQRWHNLNFCGAAGAHLYIPRSQCGSFHWKPLLLPCFLLHSPMYTNRRPPMPSLSSTPSTSPVSSRCSSPASSDFSPHISKREYLLAQIRQKDSIIESLLKQVRNSLLPRCTH